MVIGERLSCCPGRGDCPCPWGRQMRDRHGCRAQWGSVGGPRGAHPRRTNLPKGTESPRAVSRSSCGRPRHCSPRFTPFPYPPSSGKAQGSGRRKMFLRVSFPLDPPEVPGTCECADHRGLRRPAPECPHMRLSAAPSTAGSQAGPVRSLRRCLQPNRRGSQLLLMGGTPVSTRTGIPMSEALS